MCLYCYFEVGKRLPILPYVFCGRNDFKTCNQVEGPLRLTEEKRFENINCSFGELKVVFCLEVSRCGGWKQLGKKI